MRPSGLETGTRGKSDKRTGDRYNSRYDSLLLACLAANGTRAGTGRNPPNAQPCHHIHYNDGGANEPRHSTRSRPHMPVSAVAGVDGHAARTRP